MKSIVLFASGSGTNVENIIEYFKDSNAVQIRAVLTNRRTAKVVERCNRLNISLLYFNKAAIASDTLVHILKGLQPDLIVLAGFLLKVPATIITAFSGRIINIHPALLPKYGGKGMYGMNVHNAVKAAGDPVSGITIHQVNEHYDEGQIIFQAEVALEPGDSAEVIAAKVQALEYQHLPPVIEKLLLEAE